MARFLPVSTSLYSVALAVTVALTLSTLSACHAPPPKMPEPPRDLPQSYDNLTKQPTQDVVNLQNLDAKALALELSQWWKVFDDPLLDDLVNRVIEANWDLQIAAQRIDGAIARVAMIEAGALPTVAGVASAARTEVGTTIRTPFGLYNEFGFRAQLAWEPDVFGKVAAKAQAAQSEQAALEADRRAIMVAMTAEMVIVYAQLRAVQKRLALTEKFAELVGRELALTKDLFTHGLVPAQAVLSLQRQYAQAKSAIPILQSRIDILMTTGSILTGGYPNALKAQLSKPGPMLSVKKPLPATLPSQLLKQRPDISAQEQRMLASLSEIDAANAEFLPQFAIPMAIGYNTMPFSLLLNPASFLWNIATAAAVPFYTGGYLEANLQLAQSISKENQLEYERVVRQALAEVEDSVAGYQGATAALVLLDDMQKKQQAIVVRERKLFDKGLQAKFALYQAQLALTQIDEGIVDAQYETAVELTAIYKALGGGWAPPAEVSMSPDQKSSCVSDGDSVC